MGCAVRRKEKVGIAEKFRYIFAAFGYIRLHPAAVEDDDVKKILSGMNSVVDGIGSLRTHAGSAHGQGRRGYKLQARHARLAIHASHTLVGFIIETWDARKQRADQG